MGKFTSLIILSLTFVLFQNFQFVDLVFNEKYTVNEGTRRAHAKEILGKDFKKSIAAEVTDDEGFLNVAVLNLVRKNMPKKHLKKADRIAKAILVESKKHQIDPIFIASIIKAESSFNPLAVGTSGEIGLMQLMPSTAEYIAKRIKMKYTGARTLRDPVKNIKLGVAYFTYLRNRFGNKFHRYVAAYNMGPGKIMKVEDNKDLPKIYSERVLKFYEAFYKKIHATQSVKNPFLASL